MFMDDLKLYARVRENWIPLSRLKNFSDHVGMVFGLDKCAVLVLKRGKMVRPKVIELPDESV